MYREYEAKILREMEERVALYEYKRKGWTYHAKGIWIYEEGSETPSMTVLGSSNFSRAV